MGGAVGYNNCPVCGKVFYVSTADWVYKRLVKKQRAYCSTNYYCSYSCYRSVEKEIERQREEKKKEDYKRRTNTLNATLHQRRMDRRLADCTQQVSVRVSDRRPGDRQELRSAENAVRGKDPVCLQYFHDAYFISAIKHPEGISAWQSWKDPLQSGLLVNLTHTE